GRHRPARSGVRVPESDGAHAARLRRRMLAIVALAFKDLRLLLRDRLGAFFTFGFPLIMAIFFGVIFSGNTGGGVSALKIAVVDEDRTPGSERFIADLDASE